MEFLKVDFCCIHAYYVLVFHFRMLIIWLQSFIRTTPQYLPPHVHAFLSLLELRVSWSSMESESENLLRLSHLMFTQYTHQLFRLDNFPLNISVYIEFLLLLNIYMITIVWFYVFLHSFLLLLLLYGTENAV